MPHWSTADLHFGHGSIIPNAILPLHDTSHMDAILIEHLREKVDPKGDSWVLDDFSFGLKVKDEDWFC